MKGLPFYKMSGSGNDFIIIDNRDAVVPCLDLQPSAARLCRRKLSVGADGLIFIERSATADFKWRFFNADGSVAEMCGNGARCAARFAYLNGIAGPDMSFETIAGIIHARIMKDRVKISMTDPVDLIFNDQVVLKTGTVAVDQVNTGVPHVVMTVEDIDDVPVVEQGREIRFHEKYAPAGTNVDFISLQDDQTIAVRTYERGVEDETLACGTGAVAAAVAAAGTGDIRSPVRIKTRSNAWLTVYFKKEDDRFHEVYLEGDARFIYRGNLLDDAMDD